MFPRGPRISSIVLATLCLCALVSGQQGLVIQEQIGISNNVMLGEALAALGDVDGDGTSDFVVAEKNPLFVPPGLAYYVISGATGATLNSVSGPTASFGVPHFASRLRRIGDVDGDGLADLIEAALPGYTDNGPMSQDTIRIRKGNTGQILHAVSGWYSSVPDALGIRGIGDRDGDGIPDYVIGSGVIETRSGATGSLIATTTAPGVIVDITTAPDLDGDGLDDFFVSMFAQLAPNYTSDKLAAVGSTSGAVLWTATGPTSNMIGWLVPIARMPDVSGDGVDDLAVAYASTTTVFVQTVDGATGTTLSSRTLPVNPWPTRVDLARVSDVNGDGIDDVAVSHDRAGGFLHVFSGNGLTSLYTVTSLAGTSTQPSDGGSVAAYADLNGDGVGEVLVGSPGTSLTLFAPPGRVRLISLGPALSLPCASSQVAPTSGSPLSLLTVNGSAGGQIHCVHAPAGSPLAIALGTSPNGPSNPSLALWGTLGVPSSSGVFPTPIGNLCFPPASLFPLAPQLFTVANTFLSDPTAQITAVAGPLTLTTGPLPPGRHQFTLQGIVQDGASIARTNAVIVDVR